MKVDRSKIRKLQSDVPLESQELIDCIKSAAVGRDLHKVLGSMKHWPVGKCELLHWVDVLDILDDVLAENAKRTSFWSLRSDNDKAETRGLLLAVLNFTALLVEHSYSRHLYSSVEHLIALMGSSDLDVVLSVLNLFYVFSKRSTFIQKLPVNLKAPLITNLLAIANGYGGRANHLDIASCCKLHITERVRLAIDACENVVFTIPAEFFPPERGLVSIQIENVKHAVNQTSTSKPGALMDEMIRHYGLEPLLQNPFQIAAEKSAQTLLYELFNRIRLAFYFGQRNTRILCIEARLQALSILMYSNLASEQTHILLYPGIIKEFSECLFLENTTDLIDAKSGVLKCLTSVIHLERHVNHAEIVEIMQIASYHGFLPDLVRTCVRQLTSKDENAPVRFPHSFITALFSFLYHLASYDGGSEALISSGTIKTLLEVVGHHDSSDANVMFVTRAVRVLDLITNVEMAAFQQANGVSIFIDRLKYESDQCRITNPFEIRLLRSAEEPTLQSPAPQQKPARTCYHQRGALMKSILNFIKRSINDHSVADTVRHLMEGSLPDSLKHILSNCDYYGSSLFLLTAEIVSQYIFAEPSQMSYLQEIGLCDVLLYSLIKLEIPPTREVLASLPGFLGSLCLNQAGLDTFLRYKPFDRLFKVLLSPNYLSAMRRRRATNAVSQAAADPAMSMVIPSASSHSTAFVLGQAMDELMRHQPSLKESAMESLVGLLDQLIQIGSESSRVLREDSADCPPLFEYINNIARFIEAVLSSNVNSAEHMSEFIRLRGHELLLRVCFLPQIPLNHTGPPIALALSGLLRMIIQNLRNDLLIRTLFVSVDPVLSDIQKILKDRLVTHLTPCGQRIDRALAYLNTFTHILLAMLKSSSTEARSITYGLLTIEIGLDFLRRLAEIYGELVVEELVFHSMIFTPTVQSFDVQPYVRKWFETRVWDEIKCERELTDRSYLPGQVVNYTVPIYNHIVRTLRSLAELFAVVNRISATPAAIAQRNRIVFTNGAPHNVLKIINEHLLRNGFAKRENDLERIYCIAHFITFAQSILFDERRRPYHLSLCHFLTFQAETAFFDAMWWLASRIKEAPLVDCLVPSNRPPSPTTTTTTNQQQLDAMISEKDVFGHGLALIFCLLDHNVTAKSPYNLTSGEPPFSDVVFTLRMESAANSLVSLVWNNGQTTGPKLNEQLLQIISSIATDREFFGRSIKRPRNIESADLEALELSPNDPGAQIRNQYFQKANNNDSLVQVPVPQIEPPLTQISQLQIYLMNEAVQGQFLNLVENLTRGLLAALDATPDSVHKIREIVSLVAVQHNSAQWIEHFLTQLADRIIEQIKQLPNLDSKTAATASLVLANTLLQERPAHTASVFAKTSVFNHAIELINDESNELFRYLANDNSRYLATLTLFIDLYLCGIRDLQRIVPLHRRCLDQCYCVWKSYDERHGRWLSYNVRQNAMITEAFVQGRSQLRISPNRRHFVVHFNALIQLSDDQRKTRSMALWLIPHTNSELDNKIRLPYGLANLRSAPKLPFFLRSLFGAPYKQPEPFRIADHEPPLEPSQQPILQSILRILSAQTQLDSDTVHSSLRIILRLTQTPQNVSHFLNDLNGLEVLASIPSSYSFLGIMSLMIMIIKHVIDTDHNLSYSMEKFIRYTMNSQNGRNPSVNSSGATREIYALMRTLTPLICRNPTVSMETILRTLKVTEPSMSDIEDISNGYGTIMVGLRRNETGVHFKACPQTQRVINFLLDLVHRAPSTAVLSKSAILRILSELVRSYSGLGNLVMSHGTFAEIVDRYVDSDDETAPYARLLVTTIASSTNSVLGQKQLIAQIQFSLRKCVDQIVGAEATLESLAKYQAIAGLASLVVHACSSSQRTSAAGHVQFLNALKESGLIEDLVGVLTKVPLNCANENVIQTVHCVVRTIDNVTKPFYQAKNGAVATRNQPEQQQQPEVEPPTAAEEANPSAYVRIEHDEAGAAHLAIGVDSLTVNENDEELAPADDDDGDDDEEETLGEDAADVEDDTEASVDDDDDDDETAPESTVARYSDCDEEHDEEDEVELRNPEVLQAEDDEEEEEYSSDSDVEMHDALDDDVEMEEEEDANPDEEGQADSRPEDDVLGFLDEIDDDYEGDEIDMDEDDGFAGTGAPAVDGDEDEVLDDEDDEEDEEEEDEDEEEPVEEHIHFQLDIPPRIGHSGWLLGGGDDDETLGGTGPNGIYDLYSRYSENGAAMNSWITSAAHAACLAALTTEQSSAQNVGQLHLLVTNNSLVNSAANAVAAAATAGSTIPYGANLVTSLMTTNSIPQNANPSVIASAAASAAAAAITYSSSLPLIHPILLRRPAEFENFVQSTGGRRSQLIRPNRPNDAFFTASRAAAQAVSNSIGFNRPFPAAHPRFLAVGEMIHSAAGGNQQRFTATARMPGGRNDQHPRADDGITRNPVSAILNDLGLNNIPRTAEPAQMSFPTHASSTAAAAADVLLAPMVRWIEECSIVDGSAFHLSTILLRQELIIKLYAEVESTFDKKLSEYSTSTRQLSAESEPRAAPETLYEDEETQAGQEGHEDDEDIITQDEDEEMVVEEVHHQQDDVEMSEEQPATTLTQQVESAETGETQPPPQNTTEETLAVSSAANDEGPVEYFDVTIEGHTYTVPSWVDRSFLQELPHNIRLEVIQQQTRIARTRERQQQAATAATVADDESAAMPEISEEVLTSMGISIDFLDELPQNIRAEVLEGLRVQEANRIRSEEVRIEDLATNADPTQFLRSLNPQLRNQLLSELEESQLAALPEDLASEANALRVQSFRNLAVRAGGGGHRRTFLRGLRSRGGAGILLNPHRVENLEMFRWALEDEDFNQLGPFDMAPRVFRGLGLARRGARLGAGGMVHVGHGSGAPLRNHNHNHNQLQIPLENVPNVELSDESISILLVNLFLDDNRSHNSRIQRVIRNIMTNPPQMCQLIRSLCMILARCTGQIEIVLGHAKIPEGELILVEPCWLKLTRPGPFGKRVPSFSMYKQLTKPPLPYPTYICLDEHASSEVCRHALEIITYLINIAHDKFVMLKLDQELMKSGDIFWRDVICAELKFAENEMDIPRIYGTPGYEDQDTDTTVFAHLISLVHHPIIRYNLSLLDTLFGILGQLSYQLDKYIVVASGTNNGKCFRPKPANSAASGQQDLPRYEGIVFEEQIEAIVDVLVDQNPVFQYGSIKGNTLSNLTDVLTSFTHFNKATHDRILDLTLKGVTTIGLDLEKEIRLLYEESSVFEMFDSNDQADAEEVDDETQPQQQPPETASSSKSLNVPAMDPFVIKHSTQQFFLCVLRVVIDLKRSDIVDLNDPPTYLSSSLDLGELWRALDDCLLQLQSLSDPQTVLLLQPSVEAFFLVHAPVSQLTGRRRRLPDARTEREQRALNLAHLTSATSASANEPADEQQPQQAPQPEAPTAQSSLPSGLNVTYSEMAIRERVNPTADETQRNRNLFLSFANSHSKVLNHILRQSQGSLIDGPFSVLCEYTHILDFDVKRKYFQEELNQLRSNNLREDVSVNVRRDHLFEDSYRELNRRSADDWKRRFYISFEGEEGQDAGGLLREWYCVISKEIFNPNYALFMINPSDRVTYMPNPASHANSNHLSYFKFVGRVIAKAIFDSKHLDCYFTRFFYKHILGVSVDYSDMESVDHDFYKNLCLILKTDASAYELNFSTDVQEFGATKTVDLKENGRNIAVTNENKQEYVRLLCHEKMIGSIRSQLLAFLDGFYSIIPKRLISIFDEHELELLISGLPDIDVEDLRQNTDYHKYRANSLQIQWLWRALRSFEKDDLAKFVQFVTGTSKVPLGGFAHLEGMNGPQKMQIHRDERSSDRLPCAHTCFNQLDLPVYETYEKLRQRLLTAIHECQIGFGLA